MMIPCELRGVFCSGCSLMFLHLHDSFEMCVILSVLQFGVAMVGERNYPDLMPLCRARFDLGPPFKLVKKELEACMEIASHRA